MGKNFEIDTRSCIWTGVKCAVAYDVSVVLLSIIKFVGFEGANLGDMAGFWSGGWPFLIFWGLCFFLAGYKLKQEYMGACVETAHDFPEMKNSDVKKEAADWMRLKYYKMSWLLLMQFPVFVAIMSKWLLGYLMAIMLSFFPVYQIFKCREILKEHPNWGTFRLSTYQIVIFVLGLVGTIILAIWIKTLPE